MWFASITISKFSCLFLSLKQYAYILNSSYWIILTLSLLACFAFLLWLLSFLFSYSSYLFLDSYQYIFWYIFVFSFHFFIMISIELWRARIGLHSLSKSSNFPRTSSDSLLTSTTSIILFSILLVCVVYSLLIIGGIELNPGPITPTQDTNHLQGNQ